MEYIIGIDLGTTNCTVSSIDDSGKTQVIAEVVAHLVKDGKKVLISSETHKAIDNVFERMPKIAEIVPIRLIPSKNSKESVYTPKFLVDNFYINISIWHESGIGTYNKWKHLDCIRAFVYDDGYDYGNQLKINCYCPAYDENGKLSHDLTCDKCKICFQKKAKVCGCYDH